MTQYIDWGGVSETDYSKLDTVVQNVLNACLNNSSCEVIEVKVDDNPRSQSIIVVLSDGSFSTDNETGIHRFERLALTYYPYSNLRWQVRALRKDFPVTIHQNHVPEGEPRFLCLYIQPWQLVERLWTPELFLKRIFWWLRATAEGTIHGDDQPIEHLFFSSHTHVLLPEGYFQSKDKLKQNLVFEKVAHRDVQAVTWIGKYSDDKNIQTTRCLAVSVFLEPIENGPVEEYPSTLGGLEDILVRRGSSVIHPLRKTLLNHVTENGIELNPEDNGVVLVLLVIPRIRDGVCENYEYRSFIIYSGIGSLSENLSIPFKISSENKRYKETNMDKKDDDRWRAHPLSPINARCYPSKKDIRRYSGLNPDDNGPTGVIAGVGALGSLLAEIWNREGWGDWSYVDDDIVQAHNVVRHISSRSDIGRPKAVAVDSILENTHSNSVQGRSRAFVSSIVSGQKDLDSVIKKSNLIVDVTTTLHVPRVISVSDNFPRTVSAFITPSGMASVMLLEDRGRNVRCNSLEAQYYRALLEEDWGENHLSGAGRLWVGAGCREVTLSMSNELMHLHAAILSRQIRNKSSNNEARICIWEHQDDSGGTIPHDVPVNPCHTITLGDWKVLYDDGFLQDVIAYRRDSLPNETGGIIFGIVDQKDATITLVKAYPAPENSKSTPSGFSRGAYKSKEVIENCHKRTTEIVTYVGEWHSHPRNCGAEPSDHDIRQLNFLSCSLRAEGMPALMMIVSDDSVGYYIDCGGVVVDFTRAHQVTSKICLPKKP